MELGFFVKIKVKYRQKMLTRQGLLKYLFEFSVIADFVESNETDDIVKRTGYKMHENGSTSLVSMESPGLVRIILNALLFF